MVLNERKYAMLNNKRLRTKIIKKRLKTLKYSYFSDMKKLGEVIENSEDDMIGQNRMGFSTLREVFDSRRNK